MSPQLGLTYSDPSSVRFEFPCIKLRQPIGDLYVGALSFKILCTIADFDVRRVMQEERDVEKYLGIQRPLNPKRVKEIEEYVNFSDATFPGSIIIAVDERCATFDENSGRMTLTNVIDDDENPVLARQIARVIDGQHRIAGLYQCRQPNFDCPVTIVVGTDISDQAQMFARVNLSQTRVNPSLVYDLFEMAESRSPQKTCHELAVRLDRDPTGPFYRRVKRLGIATPGRNFEFLSQATVVRGIIQHITDAPDRDRDVLLRGKVLSQPSQRDSQRWVLRSPFAEGNDDLIHDLIDNYFRAVKDRGPVAWDETGQGYNLPRTNGYMALSRFFRDAVLYLASPGRPISQERFQSLFRRVELGDEEFNVSNFPPGTAGEAKLYRLIREAAVGL